MLLTVAALLRSHVENVEDVVAVDSVGVVQNIDGLILKVSFAPSQQRSSYPDKTQVIHN